MGCCYDNVLNDLCIMTGNYLSAGIRNVFVLLERRILDGEPGVSVGREARGVSEATSPLTFNLPSCYVIFVRAGSS